MRHCMVAFCPNRGNVAGVRYFRLTANRRDRWLSALGRQTTEQVSQDSSICSNHFLEKDFEEGKQKLKADAVPTLNLRPVKRQLLSQQHVPKDVAGISGIFQTQSTSLPPQPQETLQSDETESTDISGSSSSWTSTSSDKSASSEEMKGSARKRRKLLRLMHRKTDTSSDTNEGSSNSIQVQTINSVTIIEEDPLKLFIGPHPQTGVEEIQQIQSRLEVEVNSLQKQLEQLRKENRILKKTVCVEDLESDLFSLYTGLQSKEMFLALYSLFEEGCIMYFKHPCTLTLSKKDQLLLTLMKLKLNLSDKELAFRFKITCDSVSNFFVTWLFALHEILFKQLMNDIPSRNENIVDCLQIKVCGYNNTLRQGLTYSDYKQCNTFKGLVEVRSDAVVTFASKLFPSSTSDKKITLSSGVYKQLIQRNFLMADKGFPVSIALPKDDSVSCNTKPINRTDANVRINVERAIRRIKMYKILNMLPEQLIQFHSSTIFQVCAGLTNFQSKIKTS